MSSGDYGKILTRSGNRVIQVGAVHILKVCRAGLRWRTLQRAAVGFSPWLGGAS
jgi:hypothetical protein